MQSEAVSEYLDEVKEPHVKIFDFLAVGINDPSFQGKYIYSYLSICLEHLIFI